jgi:hypothetical protein
MEDKVFDEAFESGGIMGAEFEDVPEEIDEVEEEPVSADLYALVYLGHLTGSVDIGNHKINFRTLKIGEELEAALLADKYKDTVEASRALATALVAASITLVDGEPLVQTIGPTENPLEARFLYILKNWHWAPTIRTIFGEYNTLVLQAQEAEQEIKKG